MSATGFNRPRWRFRPISVPHIHDWPIKVHPKMFAADRNLHMALRMLLEREATSSWKANDLAANIDTIARALEPRITELQIERIEGAR